MNALFYPGATKLNKKGLLINRVLGAASSLTLPVCVGLYFLHKHLKSKKAKKAAAGSTPAPAAQAAGKDAAKTERTRPRKLYKVNKPTNNNSKAQQQQAKEKEETAVIEQQQQQQAQSESITEITKADDDTPDIQPPGNVMEVYDEDQVEMIQGMQAAAQRAAEGGEEGMAEYFKALQAMGFRLVMPQDGSGQMYLVPPGALEGEEDEEGGEYMEGEEFDGEEVYDEDEEEEQ